MISRGLAERRPARSLSNSAHVATRKEVGSRRRRIFNLYALVHTRGLVSVLPSAMETPRLAYASSSTFRGVQACRHATHILRTRERDERTQRSKCGRVSRPVQRVCYLSAIVGPHVGVCTIRVLVKTWQSCVAKGSAAACSPCRFSLT